MKHITSLCLLAILMPAAAADEAATGRSDSPEFKKASGLIRQLANPHFQVRETAAHDLLAMGRAAKPALQAAVDDPDPEVVDRCRRLLAQSLIDDFKARTNAFLADKDGKQEHNLPGWGRFQKAIGADKDARALFAEMLKSSPGLFLALETEPKAFPQRYAARCQELTQVFFTPNAALDRNMTKAGDLATIFFFGEDPEAARTIQGNHMVMSLLWQPAFQGAVKGGGQATAFRKLFVGWMEQRSDLNSVSQCLSMVMQHDIKEGLGFAAKVVRSREMQMFLRAQALTVIGKLGDKSHVPLLESAFTPAYLMGSAALAGVSGRLKSLAAPLDDDTQVSSLNLNGKVCTTQLRDVALAMAIHLTGQKPADYGYEFARDQPQLLFSYHYLGFADDDGKTADQKREAARKKWEAARTAPPAKK